MASKGMAAGTTTKGKVLSFIRANGEWLAVVTAFTSKASDPVISHLVPVSALSGSARRKADRWMGDLA